MQNYPIDFIDRLKKMKPESYQEIIEAINTKKEYYYFRVNISKMKDFPKGFEDDPTLEEISWLKGVFRTKQKDIYTKSPLFFSGVVYFQDLSSMLPVLALNPQVGDIVLDACASPGSKSLQIADAIGENGLLVANEVTRNRVGRLIENISRWGFSSSIVSSQKTSVFQQMPEFFDKILVDAPCSGEGMFSKSQESLQQWSPKLVLKCASLQKEILSDVLPSLREGGELVYSTCTMSLKEDEEIVDWLLKTYPELELMELDFPIPIGQKGLKEFEGNTYQPLVAEYVRRVFPSDQLFQGEGFFIAKFRLMKSIAPEPEGTKSKLRYYSYKEFPKKNLETLFKNLSLSNYLSFKDIIVLGHFFYKKGGVEEWVLKKVLPILHPVYLGVRLGIQRKDFIEPCGEWVTTDWEWFCSENKNYVDLSLEEMKDFLSKIDIPLNLSHKGFVVVGYQQKPLGIGKVVQGVLKSHFNITQGKKIL